MKKKIKWIFIIITFAILGFVGYYVYSILKFGAAIQDNRTKATVVDGVTVEVENDFPEWEGKERVNILLLGGDSRTETDQGRSDSIMVASIDPVTKQANLLSVLRDTYVEIPGHGKRKINEAYSYGGPELAMKTVSQLIDQPIHYYFFIDFESFVKLIDAIGGIEYEVEKNMYYVDKTYKQEFVINLKKGLQILDGEKALQYVRFRYDAYSDYTRTERQREFLKAVLNKMKSTTTLLNLPSILEELAPYIHTNMDLVTMIKLGAVGLKVDVSSIKTAQIPPMDLLREENINGQEVLTVNVEKLQQYVKAELSNIETVNESEHDSKNEKSTER